MPEEVRQKFEKTLDLIKVDDELGIVYGWGAIFTENGQEYFDTQGDAIDPAGAESAALDFMLNSRVAGDLHEREAGVVPFVMPITDDVAAALELTTKRTGLAIGMKPSADVLEKFKSGEYTGFSVGGRRVEEIVIEKGQTPEYADGFVAKQGDDDKKFRRGRRRRMTKWRLDEISAVDRPAQVGAKALLLKRRGEPGYDPKNPDPSKRGRREIVAKRALLTTMTDGHTHLILLDPEDGTGARPAGETSFGGEDEHVHPWVMTAEGQIIIGSADGHTHEPGAISTTQEMAMSSLLNKGNDMSDDIKKQQERVEKIALLTDVRKQHFLTLEGDEANAFLDLTTEKQDEAIAAKVAKGDEGDVIYTAADGTVYKRGDDPRLVAMAKRDDAREKEIRKLREENADAALLKRAETEFPNLPGQPAEKVALLKAVDAIEDEDLRKAALANIQAGDKAIKAAFATVGHGPTGATALPGDGSAQVELDTLAKQHIEKNPDVDYFTAYDIVSQANPDIAKRAIMGDNE